MKYAIVIPLLLLFSAVAALLPLRPGFKEVARAIMQARIASGNVTEQSSINIIADTSIAAGSWEEAGREFGMGDRLYDVINYSVSDGHKYYRCIADDTEMGVEEAADELVGNLAAPAPLTPHGKLAQSLADWLHHLFHDRQEQAMLYATAAVDQAYSFAGCCALSKPYCLLAQHPPDLA